MARSWGLTLADEGLAGVQQNVAALHDHPLDCQILPYVLSVTHFIMHHPVMNTEGLLATTQHIAKEGPSCEGRL